MNKTTSTGLQRDQHSHTTQFSEQQPSGFQRAWSEVNAVEKHISSKYFGKEGVVSFSDPKERESQSVTFKTFLNSKKTELIIYSSFADKIDSSNIQIDVSDQRITITAEKTEKNMARSPLTASMMTMQKFSRVSRSMLLPTNTNPDDIKAMWLQEENLMKIVIPIVRDS